MGVSLLCVDMEKGGNQTLQVFILKVYHAFGWLLVPKLITLVEEVQKHNRQNVESKWKGRSLEWQAEKVALQIRGFSVHCMCCNLLNHRIWLKGLKVWCGISNVLLCWSMLLSQIEGKRIKLKEVKKKIKIKFTYIRWVFLSPLCSNTE